MTRAFVTFPKAGLPKITAVKYVPPANVVANLLAQSQATDDLMATVDVTTLPEAYAIDVKGGPGSGFYTADGHCGIPGQQGGSQPCDGTLKVKRTPKPKAPAYPFVNGLFYGGPIDDVVDAGTIFRGSSQEVQDLALKTGLLATDQETYDWIKANEASLSQTAYDKYPADWSNNVSQIKNNAAQTQYVDDISLARDQFDMWDGDISSINLAIDTYDKDYGAAAAEDASKRLQAYRQMYEDQPLNKLRYTSYDAMDAWNNRHGDWRYKNMSDDEVKTELGLQGLTDHQMAVLDKVYSTPISESSYNAAGRYVGSYNWKLGTYPGSFGNLKQQWAGYDKADQDFIAETVIKFQRKNAMDSEIPRTLFDGSKRTPERYKAVPLLSVPTDRDMDLESWAFEYRNSLLKRRTNPKSDKFFADHVAALQYVRDESDAYRELKTQFDNTWDSNVHNSFTGEVLHAFKVVNPKGLKDKFEELKTTRDNLHTDIYHGTHTSAARSIVSDGYKVFPSAKAKVGRAMGDGIYLADRSSKSVQYLSDYGTGHNRAEGMLIVNDVVFGKVADHYGYDPERESADTISGDKKSWKNQEWCVKDPKAILPRYLLYVRRDYKSRY